MDEVKFSTYILFGNYLCYSRIGIVSKMRNLCFTEDKAKERTISL